MKISKTSNQIKEKPFVEVIRYSEINTGDVLILRCERGKENESILKMRSALRKIMIEKDLKILAVTPELNMENLSIVIQSVAKYEEPIIDA
jgi:hypothetical protein